MRCLRLVRMTCYQNRHSKLLRLISQSLLVPPKGLSDGRGSSLFSPHKTRPPSHQQTPLKIHLNSLLARSEMNPKEICTTRRPIENRCWQYKMWHLLVQDEFIIYIFEESKNIGEERESLQTPLRADPSILSLTS